MATQNSPNTQTFADRIRPWQCQACGKPHISANKHACPHCHTPRGAAKPDTDQQDHQARVVTYASEEEMAAGVAAMLAQGWQVAGQSSYTPRKGVGRTLLGGFLFFNRKPVTVVTYTRTAQA
jgi:hypothetical protein